MTVVDIPGSLFTRDPQLDATHEVADLLRRINDADATAWREIIRRYGGLVATTVRSCRLQDADVRDAVQTTWLRLAEHADRVRNPERLAGWLATTARREALRIRRHHATHTLTPTDVLAENVADPAVDPEQQLIHGELARLLWDLVAELPPSRRSLLRALFTDNPRRYTEVARAVGIPVGGIGPTRARALQQLRCRLHDLGLGPRDAP